MTVADAARRWGCHRQTVLCNLRLGIIPGKKRQNLDKRGHPMEWWIPENVTYIPQNGGNARGVHAPPSRSTLDAFMVQYDLVLEGHEPTVALWERLFPARAA